MENKKIFLKFVYDYDFDLGYTEQIYEVDKNEILETKDKIYINVYGKLEEER